ncbi:MAG: PD-(D/E)XK nuclease family protein, partial [Pseudomonadota bacterium]
DCTRAIDKPPHVFMPIPVPAPCPPRDARPQKLSVTAIEKWMNNPYRIYAERILKLRPLSAIDEDVTHAERGSFVHEILGDFVKDYAGELPLNARDILLSKGQQKFAELESIAPHWHYWWPRFVRIVDWFLNQESNWRKGAVPWIVEKEGQFCVYQSTTTGRNFHVTAKADRIDRLREGGAFIIDYKTGVPPSWNKVSNGLAPQLPLEGVIARAGGWGEKVEVAGFAYWRISGSFGGAGEVKTPSARSLDFTDVMDAAAIGLENLVLKFEDPQTPYMAMPLTTRAYDDDKAYAHLARTAEWASESFSAEDEDAAEEGEDGA